MSKVRILELVSSVRVCGLSPPRNYLRGFAMESDGTGVFFFCDDRYRLWVDDVSPYRSMVDFRQENLLVFRASNFRTLKWRWPSAARSVRRFESGWGYFWVQRFGDRTQQVFDPFATFLPNSLSSDWFNCWFSTCFLSSDFRWFSEFGKVNPDFVGMFLYVFVVILFVQEKWWGQRAAAPGS